MGALLGFIGAAMGSSGAFGFGAALGWFIGSTLGSLLSLNNSHTTASAGRITDFKAYNSKYGIPISKGYGCARYAGNLIWRSPVEEVATVVSQCIRSGGFFGIGGSRQCVHTTTYEYRQSGAIAFCEGPATRITRIWADGELILDFRGTDTDDLITGRIRGLTGRGGSSSGTTTFNPYNPYHNSQIRTYLGTLTQKPDILIAQALSPENSESGLDEAYAFRSIVYMVVDGMDLLPFGNRMPTFTAEVCFTEVGDPTYTYLERPSLFPTVGENLLCNVTGQPNLLVGIAVGNNKRRSIWDMRTTELLFESAGYNYDFGNSIAHQMLSPDFKHVVHIFPWSEGWLGPADFLSGRIDYVVEFKPFLQAGIMNVLYDPVRNGFWVTGYLTADLGWYPLSKSLLAVEERKKEARLSALSNGEPVRWLGYGSGSANVGKVRSEDPFPESSVGFVFRSGRQLPEEYYADTSIPIGLSGRGKTCHLMEDGRVIWSSSSNGLNNCWLMISKLRETNRVDQKLRQYAFKIYDSLGNPYIDIIGTSYIALDKSIIIVGSIFDPGIYKVYLDEFDYVNNKITLPAKGTAGRFLPLSDTSLVAFDDQPAFQRGDLGGGRIGYRGGSFKWVYFDAICMEVIEARDLIPTGISPGSTTLYFPQLDCTVQRPNGVVYWGGAGSDEALSDIVTDLMTEIDGDPLRYLTPSDIDVSELTDRVRGLSITRQQTIRAAISQLMQGFFFDAVESDGKIKFRKRGQAASFTIPESDTRAVPYSAAKSGKASLEYERQTAYEMPRELAIHYPDIDTSYLQVTQRARRQSGEANSNISLPFQIVFNKDEAAQVADILLFDAWQERQTNYTFSVSQKHILIEPGDTGVLTMEDGRTHRLRVVGTDVGANGVTEFTAVEEFENSYLSTALGADNKVPENLVQDRSVTPLFLDTTTRFLQDSLDNTPAVIGGIGSLGSSFAGGRLILANDRGGYTLVAAKGPSEGLKWGVVKEEIGHPNNAIATNVFDTETQLSIDMVGGAFPISGTTDEALSGQRLMLIDKEIIGFKTVVSPDDIKVDATDISFDAGADTIDSTSTDFVAAGFTIGMQLTIEQGSPQLPNFYWEVATVSANQIGITGNITVTQAAGTRVVFRKAGRNVIITDLLRGLYGTQNFTYHRHGARAYFSDNLFPVQVPESVEIGALVRGYATPIWGGDKNWGDVIYGAANIAPWTPTNMGYSTGSITWDRMDRIYSDGIDPAVPTDLGEKFEAYIVTHIDHNTPGEEGTLLSEIKTSIPSTSEISVPSLPILVDVYQTNEYELLSYPLREVVSSDGSYSGGGDIASMDFGITRWNTETDVTAGIKEGIESGPFLGTQALTFETTSSGTISGLEMATGACKDIEVLARVYPNAFGDTYYSKCGIFLRGTGNTQNGGGSSSTDLDVTGAMIGFGGVNNKTFSLNLYLKGSGPDSSFFVDPDDEIDYDWGQYGNYGQQFWVRARAYKNRFQARVWIEGETEPSSWQLDAYDDSYGPYFGACGLYARHPGNYKGIYCDYFSWAHRGGTAT
jgi:hypothetical protein